MRPMIPISEQRLIDSVFIGILNIYGYQVMVDTPEEYTSEAGY